VGREAYRYRLRRSRPWYRGGEQEVSGGLQCWVDLRDELDMAETLAELITDSGGFLSDIREYELWFQDMASGDNVGGLQGAVAARALARADRGQERPEAPANLQNASNEWLLQESTRIMRELARRLRER
jgi:hypothetical protein